MPSTRRGPDGLRRADTDEMDTEGHQRLRGEEAAIPADPSDTAGDALLRRGAEGAVRRAADDDEADVEGHNFGQNAMLSRNAAQARERDVQRNLREHDLKSEARRPFLKRR